jgi:hypothetical protein
VRVHLPGRRRLTGRVAPARSQRDGRVAHALGDAETGRVDQREGQGGGAAAAAQDGQQPAHRRHVQVAAAELRRHGRNGEAGLAEILEIHADEAALRIVRRGADLEAGRQGLRLRPPVLRDGLFLIQGDHGRFLSGRGMARPCSLHSRPLKFII